MKYTLEDLRFYADKLRGKNKTSGPHWPVLLRFPVLFDEFVKVCEERDQARADLAALRARIAELEAELKAIDTMNKALVEERTERFFIGTPDETDQGAFFEDMEK